MSAPFLDALTVLPGVADRTPDWLVWTLFALAIVLLIGSGFAIFKLTGSATTITPAYLFFAYYVVFVFIGGLILVYSRGQGAYLHHAGERNWAFFLIVAAGMPLFALGMAAAGMLFRFRPRVEPARFDAPPWSDQPAGRPVNLLVLGLGVVSIVVSIGVIALSPIAPLLLLLQNLTNHTIRFDYALDYARLAFESTHAGALPFHATTYQFYGNLLPLLAILTLAWAAVRRSRAWLGIGIVYLVASAFMASLTLAKNPVENLVILLFIAWVNFVARRLKAWQSGGAAAVAIGFFLALVLITNRSASISDILFGTVRRLFLVQVSVLYSLFELVPSQMPFMQGGAFWMDLRNLRPGPKASLDFGGWLYNEIILNPVPGLAGVGSASTTFLGALYADWGVPGALLGLFAVGFLCHWIFITYVRGPRTLIRWAVFIGLVASVPRLTTSTTIAIAFQYGIITSFLFGIYLIGGDRLLRLWGGRPSGSGRSPSAVSSPEPREAAR